MPSYVDIQGVHNPATGTSPPAAWGDAVRDDLEWLARNRPHCRVYNSAAILIPNNTLTALTFDSERFDVGAMHSTVSNTGRLTVPAGGDGIIRVAASIEFAATAGGGYRQLVLRVNGTTTIDSDAKDASSLSGVQLNVDALWAFVAGDYVEACVLHTFGSAINVSAAASYSPEFSAMWECLS